MRIVASGPGTRCGSQMTMCASAGLNIHTIHFGLCCQGCATARLAAMRGCVIGPALRSGRSVVRMPSPCHAAGRCSSWSRLQIHVGGLA